MKLKQETWIRIGMFIFLAVIIGLSIYWNL